MRAICLTTTLVVFAAVPRQGDAQQVDRRSDQLARGVIFEDQHTAESALDIHRQAKQLPEEARFRFLSDWVLPNEDHSTFRLQAGFTTLHPAPPVADPAEMPGSRVPSGGELVSPALDLIEVASRLDRLNELHQSIEAAPMASAQNRGDQLAMLSLIELALGDLETACTHLQESLTLSRPSAEALETGQGTKLFDAALLLVHKASERTETSKVVIAPAYQITQSYLRVPERSAWHRHFTAAYSRARQRVESDASVSTVADSKHESEQWIPVSVLRAKHRGQGAPEARWEWGGGKAENVWSHDDDYLLFQMPLRGNFAVEGDVRTFGWMETQMLVAGRWLGPYHSHISYRTGTVGSPQSFGRIRPRLSKMGEFFRYRATVRDRVATTSFNGRTIRVEKLADEQAPWVAVRSPEKSDGGVRDLRISGDPHVPETILLSASPDLSGWNSYFSERDEPLAGIPIDVIGREWQFRSDSNPSGEIIGHRRGDLPEKCFKESLLTYFRPMLEDGSLEYEFWYEPGESVAHPALDRLCFLLDPAGVKIHWLTDGRYDQTNMTPDNMVTEPANRRGPERLPLNPVAWNRIKLTLNKDTIDLALNDELIYQRTLQATNQRVFGLFHYADLSELRVRNVVWKGDWPRELPPVAEQELASHEIRKLDARLQELPDVFAHDFASDKLPSSRFARIAGPQFIKVMNDGVHAERPGTSGYPSSSIAPLLKVSGDFDIIVEYDQFLVEAPPGAKCTIMLLAVMENEAEDQSIIARRRIREGENDEERVVQCIRVFRQNAGIRRNYFGGDSVEANGGRLRLARRGARIYYLFAEHDSDQFRILGEESYPTEDLLPNGIQLTVQSHGEGAFTSVVWKRLSVHAEELSGAAFEDQKNSSD